MTSRYIQGWRVGITDHPGRQELEIEGPGELHIVIRKFSVDNFFYEHYISLKDDGELFEMLDCIYVNPGGTSLYQENRNEENSDINLEIFYLGDEPYAHLYIGCAYWDVPVAFADHLFSVFHLGNSRTYEPRASTDWVHGKAMWLSTYIERKERMVDRYLVRKMNDELREFAQRMPVTLVEISIKEAIAAVAPHLPYLILECDYGPTLLDRVGLAVVVDMGQGFDPMRISWSASKTAEDAQYDREQYQQPEYKAIRKALGIDYHWVCQLFEGFLGDSDSVVVKGMGNFIAAGKPECWVFDLRATG